MTLRLHPLRLDFTATDSVRFPAGKPGNILRGAFGAIFRDLVCDPTCESAKTCERRETCPYARIFEPTAPEGGPSGLSDWPRPFVFRAGHLDGTTVHPGDSFHFDLNIFEMREPAIRYFILAFRQIAHEGLGQKRGRATLSAAHRLDEGRRPLRQIYSADSDEVADPGPPLEISLDPVAGEVGRLRVRFRSATELKAGKRLAERPFFRILFGRARDRVSTLSTLYQDAPLDIDFKQMGQRAGNVAMTRCEIHWRDVARRSSRTGQVHPLGGFVGEAEYEGNLTEFLPILKAAEWTGVGRHTVWGKGVIEIEPL